MRRFTTPLHKFTLPVDATDVLLFRLTYDQNGETILEKRETEMNGSGKLWQVKLTQKETGSFEPGFATVKVHFVTTTGDSFVSDKIPLCVDGDSGGAVLE